MHQTLKSVIADYKLPIEVQTQPSRVVMSTPSGMRDQFLMEKLIELKMDIRKLVGSEP